MEKLLLFDINPFFLLWLRPSGSWVSISGGFISWFVATESLTQLGQLFQGHGKHLNGGIKNPKKFSSHEGSQDQSKCLGEVWDDGC